LGTKLGYSKHRERKALPSIEILPDRTSSKEEWWVSIQSSYSEVREFAFLIYRIDPEITEISECGSSVATFFTL
jgi:hypothetical protein